MPRAVGRTNMPSASGRGGRWRKNTASTPPLTSPFLHTFAHINLSEGRKIRLRLGQVAEMGMTGLSRTTRACRGVLREDIHVTEHLMPNNRRAPPTPPPFCSGFSARSWRARSIGLAAALPAPPLHLRHHCFTPSRWPLVSPAGSFHGVWPYIIGMQAYATLPSGF